MGTKKKLVLPEEYPPLESDQDFDVTIEIVESESYEARLAEFVKLTAKAVSAYVGRLDALLEKEGDASFYEDYGNARRGVVAVQKARRLTAASDDSEKYLDELRRMTTRLQKSLAKLMELGEDPSPETAKRAKKKLADFGRELARLEMKITRLNPDDEFLTEEPRGGDGS